MAILRVVGLAATYTAYTIWVYGVYLKSECPIVAVSLLLLAVPLYVFNRINLTSGAGSVGSSGIVNDTIGDFNGAPGIGPGEPFNMQLAAKIIL
jgi:hypothetical protein